MFPADEDYHTSEKFTVSPILTLYYHVHITSKTRYMGFFPTQSKSLPQQLGVLKFSSILTLTGVSPDPTG